MVRFFEAVRHEMSASVSAEPNNAPAPSCTSSDEVDEEDPPTMMVEVDEENVSGGSWVYP